MQSRLALGMIGGGIVATTYAVRRWLWVGGSALHRDIVSFSSQMIAAARATEGDEEDALFVDPYAARLAGRKAMAKRKKHLRKSAAKRQPGEKRALGNITCRTKYLDDLVLLLTQSCSSGLPDYFQSLAQAVASSCQQAPRDVKQIVLVGSGMDTRARRLDVSEDVQWFELDRGSVLQVKQLLLRSIDIGEVRVKKALENTGFDASRPTVWVLEGLVMYLSEEVNMRLLEEMEEVSAPGSVLLTSMTPISTVKKEHAASSLLASWVWGFGDDFTEVSAKHGWSVVDCMDYSSIAELYGYDYVKRDKKLGKGNATKRVPKADMIPECAQVVVSVLKRDMK